MYEFSAFLSKIHLNKSNVKYICIEYSKVKISEVSSELFNYENLMTMMIGLEHLYPINILQLLSCQLIFGLFIILSLAWQKLYVICSFFRI